MARLLVHVEGETEETFVKEILEPHLWNFGFTAVSARLLGNARQRDRRGGIRGWNSVRGDILNHLRQDPSCLTTTMVDYYALPQSGEKPGPVAARLGGCRFPRRQQPCRQPCWQTSAQQWAAVSTRRASCPMS